MNKSVFNNITVDNHTQYITIADTQDPTKTLVIHMDDVKELVEDIKTRAIMMKHNQRVQKGSRA